MPNNFLLKVKPPLQKDGSQKTKQLRHCSQRAESYLNELVSSNARNAVANIIRIQAVVSVIIIIIN